jgi:uncharacterized alkaline shock family protein YloU
LRIVGFIGTSGTGKSHRSAWVARENHLDFIIDDGLLIRGTEIIAGKSAKKEPTKIGSVKCALFTHDSHAIDVKTAISIHNPSSIMILGTSKGMVDSIAKRLDLPPVKERIFIEDIATPDEIKKAQEIRKTQGKHVIPVPTLAIKKDFSGYFLDPLQIFRKKGQGHYQLIGEKSVVRPTFTYMGKYTISDYAIFQIVEIALTKIKGAHKISRFRVDTHPEGIYVEMDLTVVYGMVIKPLLLEVQTKVCEEVENLTALNILGVNVTAKNMILPSQAEKTLPQQNT